MKYSGNSLIPRVFLQNIYYILFNFPFQIDRKALNLPLNAPLLQSPFGNHPKMKERAKPHKYECTYSSALLIFKFSHVHFLV